MAPASGPAGATVRLGISGLPNQLTLLRIVLSFVFMAVFFSSLPFAYTLSFLIFIAAALTDALDGKIARARGMQSDFGKLMDPLADKILIATAFISFLELPQTAVAAWMVVIIIAREFLITGMRLVAMGKGKVVHAELWGKHKTFWQIFAILLILCFLSLGEFMEFAPASWAGWQELFDGLFRRFMFWTMLVVVGMTVFSGFMYLRANTDIILDAAQQ